MSELLERQKNKVTKLKELILRLHAGEDTEVIKDEFIKEFKYVSGADIAQMERQLMQEGISVEEIMSLCDIHASLFQNHLEDLHSKRLEHPFNYFREDNEKILAFMKEHHHNITLDYMKSLYEKVDNHYGKKEQLLFPLLEYVDILTIPQVMWGVDNEIRTDLKTVQAALLEHKNVEEIYQAAEQRVLDMITKENHVLFQVLEEHISNELWDKLDVAIKNEANLNLYGESIPQVLEEGFIQLTSGKMTLLELENILNILPLDITFVDKYDKVAYVSQGKHRVFERPLTVIGREVKLCHPPQSVHVVEDILTDFRAKRKDHEFFWIRFKGMYVYIQYFAIYDQQGDYLGVVEVSQDIQGIQSITGEKRLMYDDSQKE